MDAQEVERDGAAQFARAAHLGEGAAQGGVVPLFDDELRVGDVAVHAHIQHLFAQGGDVFARLGGDADVRGGIERGVRAQIGLVVDDQPLLPLQRVPHGGVLFRERLGGVEDEQDEVRTLRERPGAGDAEVFHLVRDATDAGGVVQIEAHAADLERPLHRVARGAGDGGDDRLVLPEEGVEQGALARVRPAREHDVHPLLDLFAGAILRREGGERPLDRADALARVREVGVLDVLLGEVDVRVDPGEKLGQLRLARADGGGEVLGVEQVARAHFRLRLAVDHVRHPLGGGEGKFAVEKGAFGELAALGEAAAEAEGAAQDAARDARAAVAMELDDVLAREAVRGAEIDAKAVVAEGTAVDLARDHAIGLEVADCRIPGGAEHLFRDGERAVPAQPHDGDPALPRRRGDGGDVFTLHFGYLSERLRPSDFPARGRAPLSYSIAYAEKFVKPSGFFRAAKRARRAK